MVRAAWLAGPGAFAFPEDRRVRTRSLIALCLLSLGSIRASGPGPSHVFDKHADFSHYKTYAWMNFRHAMNLGELTEGQLSGTLQVALAKKALTIARSEQPDIYIAYQIVSSNPNESRTFEVAWPGGSGVQGILGPREKVMPIHLGDLVLDMYDSSKNLLWRSVVSNPVDLDGKPANRQKQMDRAAEKLLKHYPPG